MRVVIVAALFVLAGCGASTTSSPPPSPADLTPEPSTSSATPSPSPSSAASPTADLAGWHAFLTRYTTAPDEYIDRYDALLEGSEGPNPTIDLGLAALELMLWAEDQRDWLLENPPTDPCYERAWRAAVDWTDTAFDLGDLSGDVALDPSDSAAAAMAVSVAGDVTRAMEELTIAINGTRC